MMNQQNYFGLDLGSKTLGIAISQGQLANALTTLRFSSENWVTCLPELINLIKTHQVHTIVIGYPVHMTGKQSPSSDRVDAFLTALEPELQASLDWTVTVVKLDERLTTRLAQTYLLSANVSRAKRKQVIDKLAAKIILQNYLDQTKLKQHQP